MPLDSVHSDKNLKSVGSGMVLVDWLFGAKTNNRGGLPTSEPAPKTDLQNSWAHPFHFLMCALSLNRTN